MPDLITFTKPFGGGNRFGTVLAFKLNPVGAFGEGPVFGLLGLITVATSEHKSGRLGPVVERFSSV